MNEGNVAFVHNRILPSLKRKEILSFATMSLNPEGKLSGKNQMPHDLTEQCSTRRQTIEVTSKCGC